MSRLADMARALLERIWPAHPRRWQDVPGRLRPPVSWALRLTTATVIAYVVSIPFVQGPPDLTGALTALLVVQGTNLGTLRSMIVRIGAVSTGVLLAVLVSHFVGLSWWSLALVVGLALLLAKLFRLGDQSLETAISAMLILAVQGQDVAVSNRILTTLIGAAIGFLFVVLVPAPVPTRQAAHQIRSVAAGTANLLSRVAESMRSEPIHRPEALDWLGAARELSGDVARATAGVAEAREARRMNARALAESDAGPILAMGVRTLERIVLEVRNLFHVISLEAPVHQTPDDGYGEDVRPAFAWVLDTLADCIAAYGRFVEAAAIGEDDNRTQDELDEALSQIGEARATLADLMTVDPQREQGLWLLRGSILGVLRQIVAELEHEERRQEAQRLLDARGRALLPRVLPKIPRPGSPRPATPPAEAVIPIIDADDETGEQPGPG